MGSQIEIQVELMLLPAYNMNPTRLTASTIAFVIMFSVATQGLLREGEDHLFHRVDPPQEFSWQENFPINTPPPTTTTTQQPQARRKCYPACKGGAGFCHGRCVFFGMGCVQGKCSRSPYF